MKKRQKTHKPFRPYFSKEMQPFVTAFQKHPQPTQLYYLKKCVEAMEGGEESIFTQNKNGATIETPKSNRIKTIDDLVNHCQIDLDIWEIERYVVNKWEVGSNVDGQIIVEPLFQIKAWLKPNINVLNIKEIKNEILEEIKSFAPIYKPNNYKRINNGQLLEVNIFDLHFGKLCWGLETGDNYDTKIASKLFLNAISAIIKRSEGYDIKRVVFPVGNDFFNSDTRWNQTSNLTPQDEDVRWQKTFKAGRELLIAGIDLLSKVAPVDVVIVQGNHDWERSFYVGDVLSCWYHNNPNVDVNNQPTPRKHYQFGNCLITYTHGNNEKIIDLPLLVASEVPKLWAKTQFREIHVGHLHHKKEIKFMSTQEIKGITIRFMRSLSGTDAWHNLKGYTGGIRSCEAFIWDENEGLICQFAHNLVK